MSRASAGISAGFGGILGALGGTVVYAAVPNIYDSRQPEHLHPAFIGTFIGSVIGAVIGSGSCEPKQIGASGVGSLPLSHPRFP